MKHTKLIMPALILAIVLTLGKWAVNTNNAAIVDLNQVTIQAPYGDLFKANPTYRLLNDKQLRPHERSLAQEER